MSNNHVGRAGTGEQQGLTHIDLTTLCCVLLGNSCYNMKIVVAINVGRTGRSLNGDESRFRVLHAR